MTPAARKVIITMSSVYKLIILMPVVTRQVLMTHILKILIDVISITSFWIQNGGRIYDRVVTVEKSLMLNQ